MPTGSRAPSATEIKAALGDVIDEIASAYANVFTLDELTAINKFYLSDAGTKLIANQGALMQQMLPTITTRLQETMPQAMENVIREAEEEGADQGLMFETIAEVQDPSVARVLITALKAHGFHPLEGGENGLPACPASSARAASASRCPRTKPTMQRSSPTISSARCEARARRAVTPPH